MQKQRISSLVWDFNSDKYAALICRYLVPNNKNKMCGHLNY